MPIGAMPTMLDHARGHGNTAGYFEAWDLRSLKAAAEAAQELHARVITSVVYTALGSGAIPLVRRQRLADWIRAYPCPSNYDQVGFDCLQPTFSRELAADDKP